MGRPAKKRCTTHNRLKCRRCKVGIKICPHGEYEYQCTPCLKLKRECIHRKDRNKCRECGTGICACGKWKHGCKKCGNFKRPIRRSKYDWYIHEGEIYIVHSLI